MPSLVKIGQLVQKLKLGTPGHNRQHGGLMVYISSF